MHVFRSRNLQESLGQMLMSSQIRVPASRPASKTGEAETALGFPASIYFFAGRTFPGEFAKAACVIRKEQLTDGREANDLLVCPFDTGSIHHNRTRLPSSTSPAQYVEDHSTTIDQFDSYFAGFLDRFFGKPDDYWTAPTRPIDGIDFSTRDDIRNWTFEVRCKEFAGVEGARWFVDDDIAGVLSSLLTQPGMNPIDVVCSNDVASEAENSARPRPNGN